jgi:hypothetical protein
MSCGLPRDLTTDADPRIVSVELLPVCGDHQLWFCGLEAPVEKSGYGFCDRSKLSKDC